MLTGLSIQNVVLIDRLDMGFEDGLTALTGETGAGKSILLDSIGLALGARSDSGLVRAGQGQLSVTAAFALPAGHPAFALLAEQDIEADDQLLLRRIVTADGRSRAYVNDQAVSVGLLRRLGELLVEIHGQFASHGLLDAATHQGILDAFGQLDRDGVATAWKRWRAAATAHAEAAARLEQARAEETLLRHGADELAALAPRPGEETELAERRQALMHGEKLIEAMNQASALLSRPQDVEAVLRAAGRGLERVADKAPGLLDGAVAALERAAIEAGEARAALEHASASVDLDPKALETVEERLFALRAMARKHGVAVDALAQRLGEILAELATLDAGTEALSSLAAAEEAARAGYLAAARALSRQRAKAAAGLDRAVAAELVPLKLDRARFVTRIETRAEEAWTETGIDAVRFEVATNAGTEPGPLAKIASGGELARFMLALKVVLAGSAAAATIVFDEVDSAVGGAVAAAVGERLARLAQTMQVLTVTHSPQVAARAGHHWQVAKGDDGKGATRTTLRALAPAERQEEIARMLSGSTITDQARAAALALLEPALR